MAHRPSTASDVFTAHELARAADVDVQLVQELVLQGRIQSIDGTFIGGSEAVRVGRLLKEGRLPLTPLADLAGGLSMATNTDRQLFSEHAGLSRSPTLPAAVSSTVHLMLLAGVILITTIGLDHTQAFEEIEIPATMRMVYLNIPGPGGGGGGGGLKQPKPPPKARREGRSTLSSPIPVREPPPVEPKPAEPPPPLTPEPLPPIVAPVATRAADETEKAGVLKEAEPTSDSRGPGENGGVGEGKGVGLGEGQGAGIGDGSGGGTGGGPYRAGSGVDPPRLLREVKPDYTEEARRRSLTGEVLLEIVVRRDGSVGDVRLLRGLGSGLDQRATEAVRQWKFAPARRQGTPVDVIVEVAVEFKLR